jgi:hypothetical protein
MKRKALKPMHHRQRNTRFNIRALQACKAKEMQS